MGGTPNQEQGVDSLRRDVETAVGKVRENPVLRNFMDDPRTKTKVTAGSGENFGEVYIMGQEDASKFPKQNWIEIRNKGNIPLDKSIAGELMNAFGAEDLKGNPQHPEFFSLKQEFIGNMTQEQLGIMDRQFKALQQKGGTGLNSQDIGHFLKNSFSDSEIRGHLFPEVMTDPKERELFRSGVLLSPRQREIIMQMKQIIGVQ